MRSARELARLGESADEIYADLAERFPEVRSSRLREFADLERSSQDRLDTLAGLNWGQFQNLMRVTGCPEGSTGFRMNVTVFYEDPETGQTRPFNQSVTVEGSRSVNELLTSAIAQVTQAARDARYDVSGPNRITREYIAENTRFNYIDCY